MNTFFLPILSKENKQLPFFVVTIGLDFVQPAVLRQAGMLDYQWFHCSQGKGKLLIGGQEYIIEKNMGFLFAPNIPHQYFPLEEPWVVSWVTFNGYGVPALMEHQGIEEYLVFQLAIPASADKILFDIYDCIQQYSSSEFAESVRHHGFWSLHNIKAHNDASAIASAMLYYFLINLKQLLYSEEKEYLNTLSRKLHPVILHIEEHYAEDITLEDLSELLDITPSHFCRLFKQLYNIRPFVYINQYRIHKAKELMHKEPLLPISQVAEQCGFHNTSYFCSIFRKQEHMSPAAYRNIYLFQ